MHTLRRMHAVVRSLHQCANARMTLGKAEKQAADWVSRIVDCTLWPMSHMVWLAARRRRVGRMARGPRSPRVMKGRL